MPAYGVVRQTLDVDCLVVDTDSGVLHAILSKASYVEKERTENFVRYAHPSVYLMDVDILFVDYGTFDKMMQRSRSCRFGSTEIRVPCIAHLIALKLHAIRNNPERELKELGDIVALLKNNPGEVPPAELRSICDKYGPNGIHATLEGYL